MKLWQLQQVLCRYDPEATVRVQVGEGSPYIAETVHDYLERYDGECSCVQVGGCTTVDNKCPRHGAGATMRCPVIVVETPEKE
jgi:hypothetical protein